jgi:tetratricopeptide (TPR) repeat protein
MRRKLASLAAISMAVGLAACTKIESRDLIREGNQLYRDGQWEQAIEKYDESLEKEPDGVTVLWNRAMAAESIVLHLKDATEEGQVEMRKQYATLALESLDEWNEKREKSGAQDDRPECAKPKAEGAEAEGAEAEGAEGEAAEDDGVDPDLKAYQEHRLAILGADARCDDLIEYWRQMHMACPQNEDLYMTIAQTFEDICGMPDKAEEWYLKRTEDFPESPKAWYSLATRRFYPLMPDPEAGLPFNAAIDAGTRIEIADEVIGYLEKATELDPKYRDPYVWRSMAYTQKSLAREFVDPPDTPVDAIEAILARRDSMLAWRETKAVCDIEKIPDCPMEAVPGELFRDLEGDGSSWKDKEINLWGNVVNDSVKEVDAEKLTYEFDLEVEYTPPAPEVPEGEEPPPPPPPPVEGEEGEGEVEKPVKIVKVRYTFLQPVAEEGEPPPDISAEIEAQLEVWKKLKSTNFSGFIEGKGGELTLVSMQKQFVGCCPPAPLTPDEEKADAARLEELRAELAALEAAEKEAAEKEKGKKGRRGR